jgi:hypothetical protein
VRNVRGSSVDQPPRGGYRQRFSLSLSGRHRWPNSCGASPPARRRPSLRLTHLGTRARLKGHGPSDAPSAPESRGGRRNRSKVLGVAGQYTKLGGLVTQPYDADYWRQRANEARALAEAMTLPVARRVLEHIAATYERLANRAECTAGRKGTRERS